MLVPWDYPMDLSRRSPPARVATPAREDGPVLRSRCRARRRVPGALLLIALALTSGPRLAAAACEVELIALDESSTLVTFSSARPGDVRTTTVSGVNARLVGIDHRPANRRLYGISTANDVYEIDRSSGAATLVSTLTVAFDAGARSGLDFNPQADRLRLAGGNGQNLRVNVDLGAAATDGPLAYAGGDPNAGRRPSIAAAAYTNAVAGAHSTKLFDIDSELDVLALQEPPNDGVLTTIGPLGADFGPLAGFDVVTEGCGTDVAFAVSGAGLYQIDLASGAATKLGDVGAAPGLTLIGLTVVPRVDGTRD